MNKEIAQDAVVEANREMLLQRSIIGINKYGVTLEKSGLNERQLVVHALEEALDLANYLQAQLMRIDQVSAFLVSLSPPVMRVTSNPENVYPSFKATFDEIFKQRSTEEDFVHPSVPQLPLIGTAERINITQNWGEWEREEQARNARIAGTQSPIFYPAKPFRTKDSMP